MRPPRRPYASHRGSQGCEEASQARKREQRTELHTAPPQPPVQGKLPDEQRKIHALCNYSSLGMIYLRDNPLLKTPLKTEHIKNRLLGHWGASPGLEFIYIYTNRLIKKYDLDALYLAGPDMMLQAFFVYLEGTYSEIYTDKTADEQGLKEFFKQFSFPAS